MVPVSRLSRREQLFPRPPVATRTQELLCSICHDDFCDGDAVRLLPCNHYHHVACVDKWLLDASRAPACPLCNTKLEYYCKVD